MAKVLDCNIENSGEVCKSLKILCAKKFSGVFSVIGNLLLEKIPKAGIARTINISERWLQDYVNKKYDDFIHHYNANITKILSPLLCVGLPITQIC